MISILGIIRFLFLVSLFVIAPGIIVAVVLKSRNKKSEPQPSTKQTGKYCYSCGKLISAGGVFCDGCGAKVD